MPRVALVTLNMYKKHLHKGGKTECTMLHCYDKDMERFLDAASLGGTFIDMSRRGERGGTDAEIQHAADEEVKDVPKLKAKSRGRKRRASKSATKSTRRPKKAKSSSVGGHKRKKRS